MEAVNKALEKTHIETAICSPMKRSREALEIALGPGFRGIDVEVMNEFREIDFGQWGCRFFLLILKCSVHLLCRLHEPH